ncbi:MAG TPA: hypothetical protein VGO21_04655 [Candidatus Paceibacterota bacterium]|jgi:hypothetical protein|nr:hypothetical protein [Candidatus Paceibacterota bacterium]
MINLIPNEQKKKQIKSFYYRLTVVYLLAFSVCILIAVAAMAPSYFLAYVKEDLVNKKLATQQKESVPIPDQETLSVIKDLNSKLALVENNENNKFSISQKVINAILVKKMASIKITDISYQNDPLKGKLISIQGTAPSREILLLFRQALEDDSDFTQVNLPISNFVKGSDIQFYLSLIPAQPKS